MVDMATIFDQTYFEYIFGEIIEIHTHTYKIHDSVIILFFIAGEVQKDHLPSNSVGEKRPSSPRVIHTH